MLGYGAQELLPGTKLPFALGCIIAFAMLASGQELKTSPPDSTTKTPSYEVVSIEQSKPCSGMSVSLYSNRFSARCITFFGLLFNAYSLGPNDSLPGLPGWARSMQFDLEAKMDDVTAAAMQTLTKEHQWEQNQLMLRSVLADRFGFRFHYEKKVQTIYRLVVSKHGARLKEWPTDRKPQGSSWRQGRLEVRGGPIGRLAACLSDVLGSVVEDGTGISGNYDIALTWTPETSSSPVGRQGASQHEDDADANGPSLFTALQEQLGLKLEPGKGQVNLIVVDHLDFPSAN